MNAKIKLTKLTSHKNSFTANGKTFNVLIIPIGLNKLDVVNENKILLHFVCFERTSEGLGQDTHILKQDFTDDQKKSFTKDQLDAMPIIGNLIDWDKRENPNMPKTIVSGAINLLSLHGIIRDFRLKDKTIVPCIVLNVDKNYLYEHTDGELSLNLMLFEIKNPRGTVTHNIKLSVNKETYQSMTKDEQDALPFLGSATRRIIQPQTNTDTELEELISTNITDFQQLKEEFPPEINDDLPF